MIDWNIQSRADACQACQKPFANKEAFHTLLFDERHAYTRMDVCENCWNAQFSQGATHRKGFISYWQSIYLVPPAALPDAIQKDTAETLLRKLVEQNDPAHSPARFILAVMLERKRVLKVKAQLLQDNGRVFIYEHAKTGDLFNIPDPNLKLDQLEDVQRDIARLLDNGLTAKSPSASGANPAGTSSLADVSLPCDPGQAASADGAPGVAHASIP